MQTFFRFIRLPNVFTSIADVFAGAFIFCNLLNVFNSEIAYHLLLLSITSACLYANGIIWNDIFDYKTDLIERPDRALPSGKISMNRAYFSSFMLSFTAFICATVVSSSALLVSATILISTFLYNCGAKKSDLWGPLAMGLCRAFNLALGFCVIQEFSFHPSDLQMPDVMMFPGFHFLYIFSLTYLGTMQEGNIQDNKLATSSLLLLFILIYTILILNMILPFSATFLLGSFLLLGALRIIKIYRFKEKRDVGLTIKYGVLAIIPLDALLATGGATGIYAIVPAIVVLLLFVPAFLLAKVMEVT